MDIKSIKEIVNSNLPNDYQENAILSILANDKKSYSIYYGNFRERKKAK